MTSAMAGILAMNGAVALVLLGVFTWLHQQTRDAFVRTWQIAWAAYCLQFALLVASYSLGHSAAFEFAADVALAVAALAVYRSTRIVCGEIAGKSSDAWLLIGAAIWSGLALWARTADFGWQVGAYRTHVPPALVGIATLGMLAAFRLWSYARRRNSATFTLLAMALAVWAPLLAMSSLRASAAHLSVWTD